MLMCPSTGREHPGRNPRRMIVARLRRDLLGDQPARGLEVQHEDLRLQQRRGHPASHTGSLAVEDRHHDAQREQVARRQVVDRNADAHRPLARQAGDRHQPAHALRDLIDPGAQPVRAVLPEPADAAVDDARVHRLDVVVRHLQPMLHLGAHVLEDDVGSLRQPHERGVSLGRLQVQSDRALVAVQVLEVEAMAVAGDLLTVGRGRLDLDDIGAPVGEMPHRGGPRAGMCQVQHLQSAQRQAGLRLAQCGFVSGALRHPSSPLGLAPILRRNRQTLKRLAALQTRPAMRPDRRSSSAAGSRSMGRARCLRGYEHPRENRQHAHIVVYARPVPINISTLMSSFPSDSNRESRALTSSRTELRSASESVRYDCGIDPIPASIGAQYSSKLAVMSPRVSRSTRMSRNPAPASKPSSRAGSPNENDR